MSAEYISGFALGFVVAYCVLHWRIADARRAEARRCWEAINEKIAPGEMPGNGWDALSQRNGLILASNVVGLRIAEKRSEWRPPYTSP